MNRFSLICLVLVVFAGCSSNEEQPVAVSPIIDKDSELVSHLALDLIDSKVKSYEANINNMVASVQKACKEGSVSLQSLQDQWKLAMMDFHYIEVFEFGPLVAGDGVTKKMMYSLPQLNKENLVDKEIEKAFVKQEKYKMRRKKHALLGLDSIEYVLFSRLPKDNTRVLNPTTRECSYLSFVALDLKERVQSYVKNWQQKEVNFIQSPEGQTGLRAYISRMAQGLIVFTDKVLKDRKVAAPLGLKAKDSFACELGTNCHLLYLEHPYSKMAKEAIQMNLQAIEDAFSGKTGQTKSFGYNKYLEGSGAELKSINKSLTEKSLSNLWAGLPGGSGYKGLFASYKGEQNSDNQAYLAYKKLKLLTDWLKTDFIVDLNTELPGSVQGDND